MRFFSKFLLAFIIPFAMQAQTVVDVVVNSPDHTTLEAAVIAADLAGTLSGEGPFTVFAPTDAAFAAIGSDAIDALLADPSGDLTNILLNHVVSGVASTSNVADGISVGNLYGQNITFGISGSTVTVNGANVSVLDITTDNGVVHVIDAVLIPDAVPTRVMGTIMDVVSTSPVHTTLNSLIASAGLTDALSASGQMTLFAPTDDAIAALPADVVASLTSDPTGALANVLLYHAVSGVASTDNITDGLTIGSLQGGNLTFAANADGVTVNGINISTFDIFTDNGVVHVIDAVLVP